MKKEKEIFDTDKRVLVIDYGEYSDWHMEVLGVIADDYDIAYIDEDIKTQLPHYEEQITASIIKNGKAKHTKAVYYNKKVKHIINDDDDTYIYEFTRFEPKPWREQEI